MAVATRVHVSAGREQQAVRHAEQLCASWDVGGGHESTVAKGSTGRDREARVHLQAAGSSLKQAEAGAPIQAAAFANAIETMPEVPLFTTLGF